MALAAGITGREDAWGAIQSLYLEASVVGKDAHVVVVPDVLRLLHGVSLEGVGGLGNIDVAADVAQGLDVELFAEDAAYLVELMLVVGGENEGLHRG